MSSTLLVWLRSAVIICTPLLTACSATQPSRDNHIDLSLLQDQHFTHADNFTIESQRDIFALDAALLAKIKYLRNRYRHDDQARLNALLQEIIGRPNIDIRYANDADLTAAQAYRSQTANCLSLTIMAYSMAKAADVDTRFQEVVIPELWTDRQGYKLANSHVNLRLYAKSIDANFNIIRVSKELDFAPDFVKKSFERKLLSKRKVQAMFYNNQAANAIINNQLNLAYHYIKSAITLYKDDASAWSNLGLIYRKKGLVELAESVYQQALNLNPDNLTPIDNLIALYNQTGQVDKAIPLRDKLTSKRRHNPYFHQLQGDLALEGGNTEQAINHYRYALTLDNANDGFYFSLAKAYWQLGDGNKTRIYLQKAKRHADYNDLTEKYQAKLNWLSQVQRQAQ